MRRNDRRTMSTWEERFSKSKQQTYFHNRATGESVWELPPGASLEGKVRASHILAKHSGSRRPSSWREENITRSLDEARAIVEAHRQDVLSQGTPEAVAARFAAIATTESDCSSARKGGDLGAFGRGQMQPAFENAAFALQPGEVSDVVVSDSGVHIILRTA